jgi:hypothetical protein
MSDKTTFLVCVIVSVCIVLIVDFDAANDRWCKTYPEWCELVEIAEAENYEDGENDYIN